MAPLDLATQTPILLFGSAFLVALVGSVFPLSPIEVYLLAIPTVAPPALLVPIAAVATVGHMIGKTAIFLASRRVERALPEKRAELVARVRERLARRGWIQIATIFVSAVVGFPPFYFVAILGGALGVQTERFVVLGTAGRFIRFATIVLAPGFVRELL